jgi:hypothetical protein
MNIILKHNHQELLLSSLHVTNTITNEKQDSIANTRFPRPTVLANES